jgi:hypothetical protein
MTGERRAHDKRTDLEGGPSGRRLITRRWVLIGGGRSRSGGPRRVGFLPVGVGLDGLPDAFRLAEEMGSRREALCRRASVEIVTG